MPLHYINGQFTPSSGTAMIEVHDPATEEMLDMVPRGTAQDAAAALSAARAAFPTWRRTSANARAHLLHDAAAHLRQHQEQIVRSCASFPGTIRSCCWPGRSLRP